MSEKELDTTATTVEFELTTISLENGTALPAIAGNGTKALYPDLYSPDGEDARKLQMSPTPVCEGITWIKVWQRLELGALVTVILTVWGLLLLPVVFYHLPSDVSVILIVLSASYYSRLLWQASYYSLLWQASYYSRLLCMAS